MDVPTRKQHRKAFISPEKPELATAVFERKSDGEGCKADRSATGFFADDSVALFGFRKMVPFSVLLPKASPVCKEECEPGRSYLCEGQTKGSQAHDEAH